MPSNILVWMSLAPVTESSLQASENTEFWVGDEPHDAQARLLHLGRHELKVSSLKVNAFQLLLPAVKKPLDPALTRWHGSPCHLAPDRSRVNANHLDEIGLFGIVLKG